MRCKIKKPYLNENLQTKKKIQKDEKFKKKQFVKLSLCQLIRSVHLRHMITCEIKNLYFFTHPDNKMRQYSTMPLIDNTEGKSCMEKFFSNCSDKISPLNQPFENSYFCIHYASFVFTGQLMTNNFFVFQVIISKCSK